MEYYPAGQMAAYAVNRRMAGPGPHGHTGHAHTGHGHAGAPLAHHAVGHANGHTQGHATQGIDDQVISYVTDLQCGDDVGDAARGSPNLWIFQSPLFFFLGGFLEHRGTSNMQFFGGFKPSTSGGFFEHLKLAGNLPQMTLSNPHLIRILIYTHR